MLLIAKENVHGLKATLLKCITTVCIFVNFNLPCMSAFCDVMIIHEVVVVFFFYPKIILVLLSSQSVFQISHV